MIRTLDIAISLLGLVFGAPVLLVVYLVGMWDTTRPLFFQERVGRQREPFVLVKFRTMRLGTASVASHMVDAAVITRFGAFLRRTKLDELPQLWNVLRGDMSLVGPRPCLPSQVEVIAEREKRGVFDFRPGITGLAQVNNIDMSTPGLLAEADAVMLKDLGVAAYLRYILMTITGKGQGDAASL